jgi:hypothetical protein
MAPLRKRRFFRPENDPETKKKREEEALESCAHVTLDDSPAIALATEQRREGYMTHWREYVTFFMLTLPLLAHRIANSSCV